jgi:hypothetical protein
MRAWAWQIVNSKDRKDIKEVLKTLTKELVRSYIRFCESLDSVSGRFVAATFEEVTTDLGEVIVRLKKYDTDFSIFHHSKENEFSIFNNSPVHLSPSEERNEFKNSARQKYDSPELFGLTQKAAAVYSEFIKLNGYEKIK